MRGENVPVIFGLKLRQLREERGLGLKELSTLAGMSPSYVNEIEKGKKYPKADKILQLAAALHVSYDELVSLKLSKELNPLEVVLESPIVQALPLQIFGLAPRDIVDLISRAPQEAGALIRTLVEIARSYDMQVEHFFYAMLRSYQETHDNFFEDIEQAVDAFRARHDWSEAPPVSLERLRTVLEGEMGVAVDRTRLGEFPELNGFRSVWVQGPPPRLLLNPHLTERQQAFQIGREIGYRDLGLKARGITSSRAAVESFEQVLNDFKASYYAGALLIPRQELERNLAALFAGERWDGAAFLAMMARYEVTPEMFLYRLTQIIPRRFGIKGLHFLRINHDTVADRFRVTKQLNMSGLLIPAEIGLHEHYCRRWNAMRVLSELAVHQSRGRQDAPLVAAQREHFLSSGDRFFVLTLARPLALTPGTNTSVTLGFRVDARFRNTVRFWNDPAVPEDDVGETCERCSLGPDQCDLRAAQPTFYEQRQATVHRNETLKALLAQPAGR
ncbi:MAG TPA: XRE family transcriptional regulator [bacterium]|nr:XRE family transcriptional regulator [bacterium]